MNQLWYDRGVLPRTYEDQVCSVARGLSVVGDRWTLLIVRDAFLGMTKFQEFETDLGVPKKVLTERLQRLVDEDIFERRLYQERPERHEYVLTAKGRDLFPVLAAINSWGDRWLATDEGVPVVLHHTSCAHDTSAAVVCARCGEPLELDHVQVRLGPGFPERHRPAALATGRFAE